MIHITENLNYTMLYGTKSVTLKLVNCPHCGERTRYHIESKFKCGSCYKQLPPFDTLVGEKGLGHDMQRIAFHKGLKN